MSGEESDFPCGPQGSARSSASGPREEEVKVAAASPRSRWGPPLPGSWGNWWGWFSMMAGQYLPHLSGKVSRDLADPPSFLRQHTHPSFLLCSWELSSLSWRRAESLCSILAADSKQKEGICFSHRRSPAGRNPDGVSCFGCDPGPGSRVAPSSALHPADHTGAWLLGCA